MKTIRHSLVTVAACALLLCAAQQRAGAQSVSCTSATNITCLYNPTTQTVDVVFNPAGAPPSAALFFNLNGSQGVFGQMQSFGAGGGAAGAPYESFNATGGVGTSSLLRLGDPAVGGASPATGYFLQPFAFGGPLSFSLYFGGTITPCPAGIGCTPDSFLFQVLELGDLSVVYAEAYQELQPAAIPEPGTLLLVGISAAGVAGAAWRRRRAGERAGEDATESAAPAS